MGVNVGGATYDEKCMDHGVTFSGAELWTLLYSFHDQLIFYPYSTHPQPRGQGVHGRGDVRGLRGQKCGLTYDQLKNHIDLNLQYPRESLEIRSQDLSSIKKLRRQPENKELLIEILAY